MTNDNTTKTLSAENTLLLNTKLHEAKLAKLMAELDAKREVEIKEAGGIEAYKALREKQALAAKEKAEAEAAAFKRDHYQVDIELPEGGFLLATIERETDKAVHVCTSDYWPEPDLIGLTVSELRKNIAEDFNELLRVQEKLTKDTPLQRKLGSVINLLHDKCIELLSEADLLSDEERALINREYTVGLSVEINPTAE